MSTPQYCSPAIVVAIPAKNEQSRIIQCLLAIAGQSILPRARISVAVIVNNSSDDTARLARAFAATAPFEVHVREVCFPARHANAGHARAAALQFAAELVGDDAAIIATTDADSRPEHTWLAEIVAAIAAGADAVAGVVSFDPKEAGASVLHIRTVEEQYSTLQAEIIARTDPLPHDPWPNHIWAWGANLAVTVAAFRRVGGVPLVPLAEDRAFAAALLASDCRLRHSLDCKVVTSRRVDGRAPGGLADLISIYATDPDYPCDAELEPALAAFYRAAVRRRFRVCHAGANPAASQRLAGLARLPATTIEAALREPPGRGWASIEAQSPKLVRHRLMPAALRQEIAIAERVLRRLRPRSAQARVQSGGLWQNVSAG